MNKRDVQQMCHLVYKILSVSFSVLKVKITTVKEERDAVMLWENSLAQKVRKIKPVNPCPVIWVYGRAGAGKTTWTDNYIKNELNLTAGFISDLSLKNMQYGSKQIVFRDWDENCEVLVIREVNKEFPKYNDIISFIDKKDLLTTFSKRMIINNFKLIIINSLFSPEDIYGFINELEREQLFRRIFGNDGKVLELRENVSLVKRLKKENNGKMLEKERFIELYKPIVKIHKKPKKINNS